MTDIYKDIFKISNDLIEDGKLCTIDLFLGLDEFLNEKSQGADSIEMIQWFQTFMTHHDGLLKKYISNDVERRETLGKINVEFTVNFMQKVKTCQKIDKDFDVIIDEINNRKNTIENIIIKLIDLIEDIDVKHLATKLSRIIKKSDSEGYGREYISNYFKQITKLYESRGDSSQKINALRLVVNNHFQNLYIDELVKQINDYTFLVTGIAGHAIGYLFRKIDNYRHEVVFCNSGDGLQYHGISKDDPRYYTCIYVYETYYINKFIASLFNLQLLEFAKKNPSTTDIYLAVISCLGSDVLYQRIDGKILDERILDDTTKNKYSMIPQKSGLCTFMACYLPFCYLITDKSQTQINNNLITLYGELALSSIKKILGIIRQNISKCDQRIFEALLEKIRYIKTIINLESIHIDIKSIETLFIDLYNKKYNLQQNYNHLYESSTISNHSANGWKDSNLYKFHISNSVQNIPKLCILSEYLRNGITKVVEDSKYDEIIDLNPDNIDIIIDYFNEFVTKDSPIELPYEMGNIYKDSFLSCMIKIPFDLVNYINKKGINISNIYQDNLYPKFMNLYKLYTKWIITIKKNRPNDPNFEVYKYAFVILFNMIIKNELTTLINKPTYQFMMKTKLEPQVNHTINSDGSYDISGYKYKYETTRSIDIRNNKIGDICQDFLYNLDDYPVLDGDVYHDIDILNNLLKKYVIIWFNNEEELSLLLTLLLEKSNSEIDKQIFYTSHFGNMTNTIPEFKSIFNFDTYEIEYKIDHHYAKMAIAFPDIYKSVIDTDDIKLLKIYLAYFQIMYATKCNTLFHSDSNNMELRYIPFSKIRFVLDNLISMDTFKKTKTLYFKLDFEFSTESITHKNRSYDITRVDNTCFIEKTQDEISKDEDKKKFREIQNVTFSYMHNILKYIKTNDDIYLRENIIIPFYSYGKKTGTIANETIKYYYYDYDNTHYENTYIDLLFNDENMKIIEDYIKNIKHMNDETYHILMYILSYLLRVKHKFNIFIELCDTSKDNPFRLFTVDVIRKMPIIENRLRFASICFEIAVIVNKDLASDYLLLIQETILELGTQEKKIVNNIKYESKSEEFDIDIMFCQNITLQNEKLKYTPHKMGTKSYYSVSPTDSYYKILPSIAIYLQFLVKYNRNIYNLPAGRNALYYNQQFKKTVRNVDVSNDIKLYDIRSEKQIIIDLHYLKNIRIHDIQFNEITKILSDIYPINNIFYNFKYELTDDGMIVDIFKPYFTNDFNLITYYNWELLDSEYKGTKIDSHNGFLADNIYIVLDSADMYSIYRLRNSTKEYLINNSNLFPEIYDTFLHVCNKTNIMLWVNELGKISSVDLIPYKMRFEWKYNLMGLKIIIDEQYELINNEYRWMINRWIVNTKNSFLIKEHNTDNNYILVFQNKKIEKKTEEKKEEKKEDLDYIINCSITYQSNEYYSYKIPIHNILHVPHTDNEKALRLLFISYIKSNSIGNILDLHAHFKNIKLDAKNYTGIFSNIISNIFDHAHVLENISYHTISLRTPYDIIPEKSRIKSLSIADIIEEYRKKFRDLQYQIYHHIINDIATFDTAKNKFTISKDFLNTRIYNYESMRSSDVLNTLLKLYFITQKSAFCDFLDISTHIFTTQNTTNVDDNVFKWMISYDKIVSESEPYYIPKHYFSYDNHLIDGKLKNITQIMAIFEYIKKIDSSYNPKCIQFKIPTIEIKSYTYDFNIEDDAESKLNNLIDSYLFPDKSIASDVYLKLFSGITPNITTFYYTQLMKKDNTMFSILFNRLIKKYETLKITNESIRLNLIDVKKRYEGKTYNTNPLEFYYQTVLGFFVTDAQIKLVDNVFNDISEFSTEFQSGGVQYIISRLTDNKRNFNNKPRKSRIHNLIMGGGKTSMITPLVILRYLQCYSMQVSCDEYKHNELHIYSKWRHPENIFIILPENLVEQSVTLLRANLSFYFPIIIDKFVEDRTQKKFESATSSKSDPKTSVYITSDVSLKCALINNYEIVRQRSTHNIYLFDEVDTILNPNVSELNYPIGKPIKLRYYSDWFNVIFDVMLEIFHNETRSKNPELNAILTKYMNSFVLIPHFHIIDKTTGLIPEIIEYAKKYIIENIHIPEVSNILKGEQDIHSIRYTDNKKVIDILYTIYQFIDQALPSSLIYISRANYGITETSKIIIPFAYVESPVEGSQFSNPMIVLTLTIIEYIVQVKKLGENIIDDMIKVVRKGYLSVVSSIRSQSQIFKEYSKLYDESESQIPLENLDSVSQLGKKVDRFSKNIVFIREYCKTICNIIEIDLEQKNVSGVDLVMSFNFQNKSGFTGTPTIPSFIDIDDKDTMTIEPLAKSTQNLMDQAITNSSIYKCFISSSTKKLDYLKIILEANKHIKVLIDIGQQLVGLDYKLVYQTVRDIYKTTISKFVYWNDEHKPIEIDANDDSEKLWDKIENSNIFYYYDNQHTIGIDAKIPEPTVGLALLSSNSIYRDVIQGIFRMRKLGSGHSIIFVLTSKIENCIKNHKELKVCRKDITTNHLLKWLKENENDDLKNKQLSMNLQNMRALLKRLCVNYNKSVRETIPLHMKSLISDFDINIPYDQTDKEEYSRNNASILIRKAKDIFLVRNNFFYPLQHEIINERNFGLDLINGSISNNILEMNSVKIMLDTFNKQNIYKKYIELINPIAKIPKDQMQTVRKQQLIISQSESKDVNKNIILGINKIMKDKSFIEITFEKLTDYLTNMSGYYLLSDRIYLSKNLNLPTVPLKYPFMFVSNAKNIFVIPFGEGIKLLDSINRKDFVNLNPIPKFGIFDILGISYYIKGISETQISTISTIIRFIMMCISSSEYISITEMINVLYSKNNTIEIFKKIIDKSSEKNEVMIKFNNYLKSYTETLAPYIKKFNTSFESHDTCSLAITYITKDIVNPEDKQTIVNLLRLLSGNAEMCTKLEALSDQSLD